MKPDPIETKALGARLRELRGETSQAEIARRCGWEPTRIWKYETGRMRPDANSALALAGALGVTVEVLLAPAASSDSGEHPAVDTDPAAEANADAAGSAS